MKLPPLPARLGLDQELEAASRVDPMSPSKDTVIDIREPSVQAGSNRYTNLYLSQWPELTNKPEAPHQEHFHWKNG
jgi:hypothetical protein